MTTNDDPIHIDHPPDSTKQVSHDARSASPAATADASPPNDSSLVPRADGWATAVQPGATQPSPGARSPDLVSALDLVAQKFKDAVLAEVLTPNQLSWTEFQILRIVASHPKIRSVHAASRAGMTRATLSGVVDRLARRGLLVRLESLEGGRQVLLQLTDAGTALWQHVADQVPDAERRQVGRDAGRRVLLALIRRINMELDRS